MEQNYMNAQLLLDVYNRKEISPELLVSIIKEQQRSQSLSQKSNFIYLISEISVLISDIANRTLFEVKPLVVVVGNK